ncbi:MAG TPA: phosphoribosylformylglycinamidine synthase subunit PurQ, partial [Spirochaetia bacterium]|nr:phosphoribosylformylglycinamidine synthase subunit PurQ [Spirochaetia bacterium]
ACIAYGLPLISGKDSMKNDARLGGRTVSIRPTLIVSLMGIVPDVREALTTDFRTAGDLILHVGEAARTWSTPASADAPASTDTPANASTDATPRLEASFALYQRLHRAVRRGLIRSLHDVSDGGLAVALAECAIGGRLGARVRVEGAAQADGADVGAAPPSGSTGSSALFAEPTGSFVVSCAPEALAEITELLGDSAWHDIGEVAADPVVAVAMPGGEVRWTLAELVDAWKSFGRRQGAAMETRTVADAPAGAGGGAAATGARSSATGAGVRAAAGVVSGAGSATGEAGVTARAGAASAPRVLIVTGYGINADRELGAAFAAAGGVVESVHVNDLLRDPSLLEKASIFGVPGGFSYGDHVGSGMMLAHRLRTLRAELDRFRDEDGLILGICNGFQVLVKLGILPDVDGEWRGEVSLVHNDSGIFEDSWVTVEFGTSDSPWLAGLSTMDLPVRHGEGRFIVGDPGVLATLRERNLVALRYSGRNPNGSVDDIAGIVDRTGNVLGMMPHPEAYLIAQNHPHWRDLEVSPDGGLALFRNAVAHARIRRRV